MHAARFLRIRQGSFNIKTMLIANSEELKTRLQTHSDICP